MTRRQDATQRDAKLAGQDLSFLAWESRDRPMHIAVQADFQCPPGTQPPSLQDLRDFLGPRVVEESLLVRRLRTRPWPRRPRWEEAPGFRIEDHVHELPAIGRGRPARDRADALLRAPLDRGRPLWEVWLCRTQPDRFTLLLKIHHVLIDGIAGVALLERLLGGRPRGPARRVARPPRRRTPRSRGFPLGSLARYAAEHFRSGERTLLYGDVETRRHGRCNSDAREFALHCERLGGSLNDGVLAVVTGALRRWLLRETLGDLPTRLRAFCPVSLRSPREQLRFGNRIAAWFVPLPLAQSTAAGRVAALHAETARHKRSASHRGGDGMARLVSWLGGWLARAGMAIAARRRAFGVVVTNVPGPARPLELLGARLSALHPFVPLFPGQRLSIAVLRYDDRLFWGLTTGWRDRERGVRLEADLSHELAAFGSAERDERAA